MREKVNVHIVSVRFEVSSDRGLSACGSKNYHYKTNLNLKKDDLVVVETQHGYGVAEVSKEEITDPNQVQLATRWIIGVLDLRELEAIKLREAKMKELKEKMEQRRRKLEEISIYRALASEDPEIATLLQEFDGLTVVDTKVHDTTVPEGFAKVEG